LAKWVILCQPKDQGGLGIHNLDIKNTSLLSKWLYKLLTSDGTWQQILRNKYPGSKPLAQVQWKNGDSHFWASLMKVKRDFLHFGTFIIKDGSQVRFWEDIWLGNKTLREQYPSLYNITSCDPYASRIRALGYFNTWITSFPTAETESV
jgi:hypothetical protein